MTNFGIVSLPGEIFDMIISYLPKDSLASCCLVSKTWNATITPIVYGFVSLEWHRTKSLCLWNSTYFPCPCQEDGHCDPSRHDDLGDAWPHPENNEVCLQETSRPVKESPSLYLLIRTLLHNPELASLVRKLRLAGTLDPSVWTPSKQILFSLDDWDRIKLVTQFGSPSFVPDEILFRQLRKGSHNAFAALVLLCLNNLEQLEIGAAFQPLQYQKRSSLRQVSLVGDVLRQNQRFPRLVKASIGIPEDELFFASDGSPSTAWANYDAISLFQIPGIRQITLNLPQWVKSPGPLQSNANINSLTLNFAFFNQDNLAQLTRACPNLRVLNYDLWLSCVFPENFPDTPIKLSELGNALQPLKSSLKTFHLHINRFSWTEESWNHLIMKDFLSFSDFANLTTLHVPLRALSRDDTGMIDLEYLLPRSLTHLWLNNDCTDTSQGQDELYNDDSDTTEDQDEEIVAQDTQALDSLGSFLLHWRDFTPSLENLRLLAYRRPYHDCGPWDQDKLDMLQQRGSEVELKVEVITLPYRSTNKPRWGVLESEKLPYFNDRVIEAEKFRDQ